MPLTCIADHADPVRVVWPCSFSRLPTMASDSPPELNFSARSAIGEVIRPQWAFASGRLYGRLTFVAGSPAWWRRCELCDFALARGNVHLKRRPELVAQRDVINGSAGIATSIIRS